MFFDIPVVVQKTVGRRARIGWCGVEQDSLSAWARGVVGVVIVIVSRLLRKCNTCDSKCIFHCHNYYVCVIIAP